MKALTMRRIAFSGFGAGLCFMAWHSYVQMGIVSESAVPAALGVLLIVMGITAKGG